VGPYEGTASLQNVGDAAAEQADWQQPDALLVRRAFVAEDAEIAQADQAIGAVAGCRATHRAGIGDADETVSAGIFIVTKLGERRRNADLVDADVATRTLGAFGARGRDFAGVIDADRAARAIAVLRTSTRATTRNTLFALTAVAALLASLHAAAVDTDGVSGALRV